jgi:hypothetical protein
MRTNGMKFGLDWKVEFNKIIQTLRQNFVKCIYKSCIKFCPFSMARMNVTKMKQKFNKMFKPVKQNLAKIFWSLKELNQN